MLESVDFNKDGKLQLEGMTQILHFRNSIQKFAIYNT